MSRPIRDKIHSLSLGARIVWVFIFVALFSIFIFGTSFKLLTKGSDEPLLPKILADYGSGLIAELGEPAQLVNAKKILQRTGMDVYIQKGGSITGTTEQAPKKELLESDDYLEYKKNDLLFQSRFVHGQAILTIIKPTENIIFVASFRHNRSAWVFFGFISSIILVIYLAYRMVRYLVSPIQDIEQGVEKFSKGDLSYRIKKKRNDDLGELTEHINQMAEQLNGILEAKHQLLLAISHELRTPMTRMNIALDLPFNEKNKSRFKSSLLQMEQLLSELLETEKLNSDHQLLEFHQVSLNELVTGLIEQEYPKNKQIIQQLTSKNTMVSVDAMRIRLLLRNLISNSIKYGLNKPITISTTIEKGWVVLLVKDEGEGIDKKSLKQVFEAFYREDQARQRQTGGTGLGLYLVQLIVNAHDGEIDIKSTKGVGTVVRVKLKEY